jgi:dolichyl-phosphate-mannose--protein O-mannosyl transferase
MPTTTLLSKSRKRVSLLQSDTSCTELSNIVFLLGLGRGWDGDNLSGTRLRTLRTKFLLRHQLTGCYLFSHKVKLPEWGYEQQEVTCNKNAVRKNSLWFIETNTNPLCECNLMFYISSLLILFPKCLLVPIGSTTEFQGSFASFGSCRK